MILLKNYLKDNGSPKDPMDYQSAHTDDEGSSSLSPAEPSSTSPASLSSLSSLTGSPSSSSNSSSTPGRSSGLLRTAEYSQDIEAKPTSTSTGYSTLPNQTRTSPASMPPRAQHPKKPSLPPKEPSRPNIFKPVALRPDLIQSQPGWVEVPAPVSTESTNDHFPHQAPTRTQLGWRVSARSFCFKSITDALTEIGDKRDEREAEATTTSPSANRTEIGDKRDEREAEATTTSPPLQVRTDMH